jgi:hypothetical protein
VRELAIHRPRFGVAYKIVTNLVMSPWRPRTFGAAMAYADKALQERGKGRLAASLSRCGEPRHCARVLGIAALVLATAVVAKAATA